MHDEVRTILRAFQSDINTFERLTSTCEVWSGVVAGSSALELWRALSAAHPRTGFWPVFRGLAQLGLYERRTLGEPGTEMDVFDILGLDWDAKKAINSIPQGSVRELLADRVKWYFEFGRTLENFDASLYSSQEFVDTDFLDFVGCNIAEGKPSIDTSWPAPAEQLLDLQGIDGVLSKSKCTELRLALVAVKHPYEAPVALGYGGWNECPHPTVLAAMLREWERTHGAVPVSMTNGSLECLVERPPQTEIDSFRLALDQYLVCEDIVLQGTGTVQRLAIEIWQSPTWYFWWD